MSVSSDSSLTESARTIPASVLVEGPTRPLARSVRIGPTDGELLTLFTRHGDRAAFDRLINRHAAMVWRVCRQSLRRQQDAEDAFQATFLMLVKNARSVRSSDSAAGWLYRVAYRNAIRARKKLAARREESLSLDPLAPSEAAFPDLLQKQTAGVLLEELGKLPERYQTPLVMRYLEGQSRRAIADQTDTTIAAVQGQLARGKQLLRRRLLRRGVSLSAAMTAVSANAKTNASAAETTVSAQVVAQTTSNSVAIATGGSLAASAAAVSLYQEGMRAMLLLGIAKPTGVAVAVAAVALLAMVPGASGDRTGQPTATRSGMVLDAGVAGATAVPGEFIVQLGGMSPPRSESSNEAEAMQPLAAEIEGEPGASAPGVEPDADLALDSLRSLTLPARQTLGGVSTPSPSAGFDAGPHARANQRVREILRRPLSKEGIDFQGVSLKEVLELIGEQHGIDTFLQSQALDELGLGPDEPITGKFAHLPLGVALEYMLSPLELRAVARNGVLMVTSEEKAAFLVEMRVYSVADLLKGDPELKEQLLQTITQMVEPDRWAGQGGGVGELSLMANGVLSVLQTQRGHEQLEALLGSLRQAARTATEGGDAPRFRESPREGERRSARTGVSSTGTPTPREETLPKRLARIKEAVAELEEQAKSIENRLEKISSVASVPVANVLRADLEENLSWAFSIPDRYVFHTELPRLVVEGLEQGGDQYAEVKQLAERFARAKHQLSDAASEMRKASPWGSAERAARWGASLVETPLAVSKPNDVIKGAENKASRRRQAAEETYGEAKRSADAQRYRGSPQADARQPTRTEALPERLVSPPAIPKPDPAPTPRPSDAAAARTESMNRLRKIGLALMNYESEHGHFPSPAVPIFPPRPLLSWRVAMLPYLGEQELYDRFKHDEAWDSAHNVKLLSEMPAAFHDPRSSHPRHGGRTNYVAATGQDAFFQRGKERQFIDVRDGTSHTIALIEVHDTHAVNWTRPDDFDLGAYPDNPRSGIGSFSGNGEFLATLVDGSVKAIGGETSSEQLRQMLLIDDQWMAAWSSSDSSDQYGPNLPMRQGRWRVFHKPSEMNPNGWAVVAELRPGEHAPILLPGDKRPRPHLVYQGHRALGDDKGSGFSLRVVDPGHDDDGKEFFAGPRTEVRGVRFFAPALAKGDRPDSILLVIRRRGDNESDFPPSLGQMHNPELAKRLLEEGKPEAATTDAAAARTPTTRVEGSPVERTPVERTPVGTQEDADPKLVPLRSSMRLEEAKRYAEQHDGIRFEVADQQGINGEPLATVTRMVPAVEKAARLKEGLAIEMRAAHGRAQTYQKKLEALLLEARAVAAKHEDAIELAKQIVLTESRRDGEHARAAQMQRRLENGFDESIIRYRAMNRAYGHSVRTLQEALQKRFTEESTELEADGEYGPGTAAAVAHWQRRAGLPPTGFADKATRVSLDLDDPSIEVPVAWHESPFNEVGGVVGLASRLHRLRNTLEQDLRKQVDSRMAEEPKPSEATARMHFRLAQLQAEFAGINAALAGLGFDEPIEYSVITSPRKSEREGKAFPR